MTYEAPVEDLVLALKSAAGIEDLISSGVYEGLDIETIAAILEEAGRFGAGVLAPINETGDRQGAKLDNGTVKTPDGWQDAYKQFSEGGWCSLSCPTEYGGQGLPKTVSTAVGEIWNAANAAFGIGPLLTQGAIDAIHTGGSEDLKNKFLPDLVSGKWSGTMNLTEPQAGSDLAALTSRAEPQGDGSYKIFGTKIFISYGEHELTENILHLVLARLPDAPEGTRGISLFLVPKYIVNPDGSKGERNDVVCTGVEKKLGIHGSPTCVMTYGDKGGAIGYLVGEEHRGLKTMFIMMNAARLGVAMQGVALADRATQRAVAYANERRQGRDMKKPDGGMVPIIAHPDVRRALLEMRALTQACRLICLRTARELDLAELSSDESERENARALGALLTPVAKAYSTDIGCEVSQMGVQVHGGMGYIEETGAAQTYRDARIFPIYEGTNGIQAIDLVARKLPLQGGETMKRHLVELSSIVKSVAKSPNENLAQTAQSLGAAVSVLQDASLEIGAALKSNPERALAVATPYLRLFGIATGGAYLAKCALDAEGANASPVRDQTMLVRVFANFHSTLAPGLAQTVKLAASSVLDSDPVAI